MEMIEKIDYSEYSNLQLLIPPGIIFILAIAILGISQLTMGIAVPMGFEFTGGVQVRVTTDSSINQIQEDFSGLETVPSPDNIRSISDGYIVVFSPLSNSQRERLTQFATSNYNDVSIDSISAAYGQSLLQQGVWAVIFAFILMAIAVFAFFRTFIPSIAVVASAFGDMIFPLGSMSLIGIDLSLATIPALLLLIGYSIDSDILLTRTVLKGRKSEFYQNVKDAMRTGITMTLTSMAALAVMAIVSHLFSVFILRDIGLILFLGLFTDLINTYSMNVALLRWHIKE